MTHGSSTVARLGSLADLKACCSSSLFAHKGTGVSVEKVTDVGNLSIAERLDVNLQTLHLIVPLPSTDNVEWQHGQKGHPMISISTRHFYFVSIGSKLFS